MIKITVKLPNLKSEIDKLIAQEQKRVTKELINELANNTPVDTGKAKAGWHEEKDAIVNDVEYISALNEGHSKQAPALFIEQTILNNKQVTPNGVIVEYTDLHK